MKQHIIFDFDDTVSSAYESNQQLFVDTILPYKKDIDQDYLRNLHYADRGTSMLLQFEKVVKKFSLEVPAERLVKENEDLHQKYANKVKIFSGFTAVVKHFKKHGKVISICTNRARGSLEIILKRNKVIQYLDNIISCSDEGYEKPDPYCLVKLMEKYPNLSKNQTIYFGDSKTDAEFAANAGIDFLIIDHYLNKKQFYTAVLESFATSEDELLVETDSNNKEIGVINKMDAHMDPTRYHRAVHIMLFNAKGEIVLQRRAHTKTYDPGAWDMPGGHQAYGQTIDQTAEIELQEEMGIKSKLHSRRVGLKQDGRQSEYYYLYYTVNNGPYHYDKHEVVEIKAFNCERLLNHEYDRKYNILEHIYKYTKELKDVWTILEKKGRDKLR